MRTPAFKVPKLRNVWSLSILLIFSGNLLLLPLTFCFWNIFRTTKFGSMLQNVEFNYSTWQGGHLRRCMLPLTMIAKQGVLHFLVKVSVIWPLHPNCAYASGLQPDFHENFLSAKILIVTKQEHDFSDNEQNVPNKCSLGAVCLCIIVWWLCNSFCCIDGP